MPTLRPGELRGARFLESPGVGGGRPGHLGAGPGESLKCSLKCPPPRPYLTPHKLCPDWRGRVKAPVHSGNPANPTFNPLSPSRALGNAGPQGWKRAFHTTSSARGLSKCTQAILLTPFFFPHPNPAHILTCLLLIPLFLSLSTASIHPTDIY